MADIQLGWEVYVEPRDYMNRLAVYLHKFDGDDRRLLCYGLPEIRVHKAGEDTYSITPSLEFSREQARRLMSELWRAGVRPEQLGSGHPEEEIGATRKHLEDMRALAFGKIGVAKP